MGTKRLLQNKGDAKPIGWRRKYPILDTGIYLMRPREISLPPLFIPLPTLHFERM
jgi:hypothetical protein